MRKSEITKLLPLDQMWPTDVLCWSGKCNTKIVNQKEIANKNPYFRLFWKDVRSGNSGPIFQREELAGLSSSCLLLAGEWAVLSVMFFTYLFKLPA